MKNFILDYVKMSDLAIELREAPKFQRFLKDKYKNKIKINSHIEHLAPAGESCGITKVDIFLNKESIGCYAEGWDIDGPFLQKYKGKLPGVFEKELFLLYEFDKGKYKRKDNNRIIPFP